MVMYAVVHENHIEKASVKLMGDTRKEAIMLWEFWNRQYNIKFGAAQRKEGWKVQKYIVKAG